MNKCQKKLGQILVEDDKVNNTDIENALEMQKNNNHKKLLGKILIESNLISKDTLLCALDRQLQDEVYEKEYENNTCGEDNITNIALKYKDSKYFNDLNEFIAVITHKMRNPLAGISAAVEVLRDKTGENDSNEKYFQMILKEVDRMDMIMKEIFKSFSRK